MASGRVSKGLLIVECRTLVAEMSRISSPLKHHVPVPVPEWLKKIIKKMLGDSIPPPTFKYIIGIYP
jgi:hypothetical protein